jgi:hypothetical protein
MIKLWIRIWSMIQRQESRKCQRIHSRLWKEIVQQLQLTHHDSIIEHYHYNIVFILSFYEIFMMLSERDKLTEKYEQLLRSKSSKMNTLRKALFNTTFAFDHDIHQWLRHSSMITTFININLSFFVQTFI